MSFAYYRKFLKYLKNDDEAKEVFSSSFGIIIIRVFALCLSFLLSILIARILGVSEFGAYSYAYSIATILALISISGFDRHTLREVSILIPKKSWSKIKGIRKTAEISSLLISFVLASLAIIWFLKASKNTTMASSAVYAVLLIPLIGLLRIEAALLRSNKQSIRSQIPDQIIRPLSLVIMISLYYLATDIKYKGSDFILLHSIAAAIALAWSFWEVKKILPKEIKKAKPEYEIKTQFISSFYMGGIAVFGALNTQIPLIFMGTLSTPEQTGVFSAALRISQLVTFSYAALNMAIAPSMARLNKLGDITKMEKLGQITALSAVIISLPIVVGFYFFSNQILSVFGEGFDEGSAALKIMVFSQLFHVSMGSVSLWLMMSKNEKYALVVHAISLLVTILISVLLIPKLGSVGGGIATASGMIFTNLLLAFAVIKVLGFNPTCYGMVSKWKI